MAKIRREDAIQAALDLLDEVGLDAFTTRKLARKLGVESASLYWHFKDKAALLGEMAAEAIERHHTVMPPDDLDAWPEWFAENTRSLRRALLAHRDGARLHAGSTPTLDQVDRVVPKLAYLVRAGFPQRQAQMALLAASQFTIGCVMEEQARAEGDSFAALRTSGHPLAADAIDIITNGADAMFEFGLGLLLDGLRRRLELA